MEKQEKKNNKALYVAVAIILVVALLAGTLGGIWYRKTRGDVQVEQSNALHKSLSAGFTDVKITNKTSAVEAVQSVKEKLGMTDASEELEVVGTQKIKGDKYYRMQQYHKGIPVYGRNVVVGADEDGNALSLTTNYEPIGGELSTDPSVDEATVKKNVEKQLRKVSKAGTTKAAKTTTTTAETTKEESTKEETTEKTNKETTTEKTSEETTEETTQASTGNFLIDALEQSNLVFYDFLKKGEAVLSYALNVKDDATGFWKAIIDAKTGEVLDMLPMTFTSAATVEDSAGNSFTASYKSAQGKYVLEDESLQTFIATYQGADSNTGAPCVIIESEDEVFGNTATEKNLDYNKAAKYYRSVTNVQKRFKSLYGAKADNVLVAMYNDGNDYGNNGYASSDTITGTPYIKDGTPIGIISIGTLKDVGATDLIAHEYMHRVEQNKVGLIYRSESGALMEAYSDIFGELLEADIDGKSDWNHSGIRSLADPLSTDDPAVYMKDNWGNTGADYDYGYVHQNSTVMSHAAYLMHTGIGESAALNDQQLGHLWMEALNRFVQNETFQQAASAIYATAQDQARYGRLTPAQVETVAKAFAEVGLPVTEEAEKTTEPKAGLLNKKQELQVPKTLDLWYGPEHHLFEYKYDLDKHFLTVEDSIQNDFTDHTWGHGHRCDWTSYEDGFIWAGMFDLNPEILGMYFYSEGFPDEIVMAYNPIFKSGAINQIHVVGKGTYKLYNGYSDQEELLGVYANDTDDWFYITAEDNLVKEIKITHHYGNNIYTSYVTYHYEGDKLTSYEISDEGEGDFAFSISREGLSTVIKGNPFEYDTTWILHLDNKGKLHETEWLEDANRVGTITDSAIYQYEYKNDGTLKRQLYKNQTRDFEINSVFEIDKKGRINKYYSPTDSEEEINYTYQTIKY